ncbi:MAG: 1-(5-phosphoribosyl)-5-((5-phosphoribosylamino)methylideneamino) imidazole-4-carboxamide isomerase [Syntrophorhabdaceae bacterium PtaU1.Bin034]|nr:MAG: 1-(5-phosphoribosyl)-5-((5-phosphoribosylamino)methylideneamino) imidazole-4-carboxamide isomerase [Syntrophorhabdaceae bacterium PtaU1.Bin034]
MKIFFAMDLIAGQAVRLVKGDFMQKTVYSDNPPEMIEQMRREGAKDFHVIDLDGARTGSGVHTELVKAIRSRIDGYLEVGGGIRSEEDIARYSEAGVNGIIVGTRALTDQTFFERLAAFKNIVLGLDMYEGKLMVKGWKEAVPLETVKVLEDARRVGIMALLCTNIAHDGMLTGPDFEGIGKMQSMTPLPLIASGGVSSVDDLKRLRDMDVWAAIVGKAFYEGRIRIEEAMNYAD